MGFFSRFRKDKPSPAEKQETVPQAVEPRPSSTASTKEPWEPLLRAGLPAGPDDEAAFELFREIRKTPAEGRMLDALVQRDGAMPLPERLRASVAAALVDRGERGRALQLLTRATSTDGLLLAADLFAERGEYAAAVARVERVLLRNYDYPGARERHDRYRKPLGYTGAKEQASSSTTTVLRNEEEGPFRIVREIGRGGAGAVYEAEDRILGRRVALKMYHQVARERAQLESEAWLAVRLAGPGVLRVFDVDPEEGWIAYEWARFGSVRDHLRAGDLSILLPLHRWLLPLAEALARLHRQGVVHNDVKPANVLFTGKASPVLADFGIARSVGEPAPQGSLGYMSPERMSGRESHVKDDVYGFGRLLEDVLLQADPAEVARARPIAEACLSPDATRPADGQAIVTRLKVELAQS